MEAVLSYATVGIKAFKR